MSQAITRHFVHFGNTHIDGGERKGRIVEIAGDVGFSGEHTHGEHQTARGTPHPSNYRINAIICHLLTLEKAIKGGVTVHSGGDDLRLRVL